MRKGRMRRREGREGLAAVRGELGGRMMWAVIAMQCGVAWLVAFAVRLVGLALGLG